MDSTLNMLSAHAPFLVGNWTYILAGTSLLLCGFLLWKLKGHEKGQELKRDQSHSKMIDKGDHPLTEFEDVFDATVGPAIHPPDTPHIVYPFKRLAESEMKEKSHLFYQNMNQRRSIRDFSLDPVPIEIINNIIKTAGTSPSGAHSEPWTFVVVKDPKIKSKIRAIVEQEEYLNYDHRMGEKWVHDLKFVGTTHEKPYLETAPYIIVVFKQQYHVDNQGTRFPHYYYEISTAMASGILVAAIHNAGLVTVTTTPLNAGGQLREVLGRPQNEKVMLLLPVGYPAEGAEVPDVKRKELEDIMVLI